MKKLQWLFYSILSLLAIVSCSDDDDDEVSIVGRWQATSAEVTFVSSGITVFEETDEDFDAVVEFKGDGTIMVENDGVTTEGTYELNGDQLTTDINLSTDIVEFDGNFEVEELTKTGLELYTEKEVNGTFPDLGNVQGTGRSTVFFTRL